MNLALDFGNTFTKAGLFEDNNLKKVITDIKLDCLPDLVDKYTPENIIISSVSVKATDITTKLEGERIVILKHDLPLPFKIAYQTPETLGLDRIAAVAGAQEMFPGRNCLVIDTGTCFTYDLLDHQGVYHGGGISPGIKMRFQALHTFTANLPLIGFEEETPLIGQSTKGSILSGVVNGTVAEITEIIRQYRDKFADLQIIMCGGDAKFFENRLKASIFAAPELVLRGLNRILLYNV